MNMKNIVVTLLCCNLLHFHFECSSLRAIASDGSKLVIPQSLQETTLFDKPPMPPDSTLPGSSPVPLPAPRNDSRVIPRSRVVPPLLRQKSGESLNPNILGKTQRIPEDQALESDETHNLTGLINRIRSRYVSPENEIIHNADMDQFARDLAANINIFSENDPTKDRSYLCSMLNDIREKYLEKECHQTNSCSAYCASPCITNAEELLFKTIHELSILEANNLLQKINMSDRSMVEIMLLRISKSDYIHCSIKLNKLSRCNSIKYGLEWLTVRHSKKLLLLANDAIYKITLPIWVLYCLFSQNPMVDAKVASVFTMLVLGEKYMNLFVDKVPVFNINPLTIRERINAI